MPTFYTDSDVLWYNQPRFIEAINLQESRLLLSIDPHPGYYEPMIDQSAQDLMQPPMRVQVYFSYLGGHGLK